MTGEAAPIDTDALARGGPIRWLVVGGLLLIGSIAIGAAMMAGNSREFALRSSERELENTVLLLARHFDQQCLGALHCNVVPAEPLHQVQAEVESSIYAASAIEAVVFGHHELGHPLHSRIFFSKTLG